MQKEYYFEARRVQRIKLPSEKPVGFKWKLNGKGRDGIDTNIRQNGDMLDAVNFTDKPAVLTIYFNE